MRGKYNKTDSSNPDLMHMLLCSADPVAMTCIVEAGGKGGMQTDLTEFFANYFEWQWAKFPFAAVLKIARLPICQMIFYTGNILCCHTNLFL